MTRLTEEMSRELARHVDNVVMFDAIDSTHAFALRLIDQVDTEGLTLRPTVVCAAAQSHGVGRGSRRWASPTGGLYLSWVGCGVEPAVLGQVPMLAAAAAHAAAVNGGARAAAIKWPNDILVEGRKLAGILIHARRGETTCLTVGLGFNIAPVAEPVDDAIHEPVGLAELIGGEEARMQISAVAVHFVAGLTRALDDPASSLEHWRAHLLHRSGDQISVRLAGGAVTSGAFAGLTSEGYLRLADGSGSERVITGGDVIESSPGQ